jgi:ketosteroid isomerase-like protein
VIDSILHSTALTVQYLTGRARLSGVETEFRYAVVYTLREGRIFRVKEYRDREAALAALCLDAEGASPGS